MTMDGAVEGDPPGFTVPDSPPPPPQEAIKSKEANPSTVENRCEFRIIKPHLTPLYLPTPLAKTPLFSGRPFDLILPTMLRVDLR